MFLLVDIQKAIASWSGLGANGQPPDFSAPCQPNPTIFKKYNSCCKQAHTIKLKEKSWSLNLLFEP